MFCFSSQEVTAQIYWRVKAPVLWGTCLGAHACRDMGSVHQVAPNLQGTRIMSPVLQSLKHKHHSPDHRAIVWQVAELRTVRCTASFELPGMGGRWGAMYFCHKGWWDIGKRNKNMDKKANIWLATLPTWCWIITITTGFFLLRDCDSLFIPYRKGNSRFPRLKLY